MKKEQVFDLAVVESFCWTPHLGASFDIAIQSKMKGENVIVFFIHNNNLEENRTLDSEYGTLSRKKAVLFKSLLKSYGIECIVVGKEILSSFELSEAKEFAEINKLINGSLLRELHFNNVNLGIGVYSSLVSITNELEPEPSNHQEISYGLLENSVNVLSIAKHILKRYSFKKLISFNGRFASCIGIFEACKLYGMPYIFHERGSRYNKYQIFEQKPHDIEYVRNRMIQYFKDEPNEDKKRKVAEEFFNDRLSGRDTGWQSFAKNFTEQLEIDNTKAKRQLVYFSSSDFEFSAFEDLAPHTVFKSQKAAIDSLCSYIREHSDSFNLIIRVHPNLVNAKKESDFLLNQACDNIKVIPPDSKISSYDVLKKGEIIIGYGSTILAEAVYQGKVVITLFNAEYCLKGFPVCYQPATEQEMISLLNNHSELKPFNKDNIIPWAYWMGSHGYLHKYYRPKNLFEGKFLFKDFMGKEREFDIEWASDLDLNEEYNLSSIFFKKHGKTFISKWKQKFLPS